jgi:hypothetical protein
VFSQTDNYTTYGKFVFDDTLLIPQGFTVTPGQIAKNGDSYFLGLYDDDNTDSSLTGIYKIDMTNTLHSTRINIHPPDGFDELFQCSASGDESTIVFVTNNYSGWIGNDLAIAERASDGKYVSRRLDELSSKDTVDAYPWISYDGLRLYFVKNETIYYSERKSIGDKFSPATPLPFTNTVETPIRSVWLTKSEKEIFYISNNVIYSAKRKKQTQPFKIPAVFTKEFYTLEFIAGLSFSPDKKDLYLYHSGDVTTILHYKLR